MKKKYIKWSLIGLSIIIIIVLILLIYNTLFASNKNARNSDFDNYKITNNEINAFKDKIKEIEQVKNIDIHTNNNSRIIKVIINLSEDVDFNNIKALVNDSILNFSESNQKYFDFEFYIDSENTESEVYPKIGYKFRANSEFSW